MLGKIPPDVMSADVQSGHSTGLALRFDHHTYLPEGWMSTVQGVKSDCQEKDVRSPL
jgi:hypothetical protein